MKGKRALVLAALFGLLTAVATFIYIDRYQRLLFGGFELQPVVVARQNVLLNTPINSTMVEIRRIPKPYIQPQAVRAVEGVEGFIASANILQGEQILDTKLSRPSERAVNLIIPRELRAVTMSINEVTGVAGLVRPMDRVDILGTFQIADKKNSRLAARAETKTLLQNIEVLAVGRNYVQDPALEAGSRSAINSPLVANSSNRTSFSNITLALNPRQAMDLTLAQQLGVLTLTLRSYYDRPGSEDPTLSSNRSTPASVTGIDDPIMMQSVPKWLEIRGEQVTLAP